MKLSVLVLLPAVLVVTRISSDAPLGGHQPRPVALDTTLRGFEGLLGGWKPGNPPARPVPPGLVVHEYTPLVGGRMLRVRENFIPGRPECADLEGLVYWDVASERLLFVAVAGAGPGQGRVFHGEYRVLSDGAVERVYDVTYRTTADTPGEELGGRTRRYREVYRTIGTDSLDATLEWWVKGAWRPFGPGKYALARASRP